MMVDKLKKPVRFDYSPNIEVEVKDHKGFAAIMRTMRIMQKKVHFK